MAEVQQALDQYLADSAALHHEFRLPMTDKSLTSCGQALPHNCMEESKAVDVFDDVLDDDSRPPESETG